MYFVDKIKKEFNNEKIDIYVDMDGVIADYQAENPFDFANKRPVRTNIKIIEKLNELDNVTIKILSICKKNKEIELKKQWLNKYASFLNAENIFILSKEKYPNFKSKEIKFNFLKQAVKENKNLQIILIDDDNGIVKHIKSNLKEVIVFQDSSIID